MRTPTVDHTADFRLLAESLEHPRTWQIALLGKFSFSLSLKVVQQAWRARLGWRGLSQVTSRILQ